MAPVTIFFSAHCPYCQRAFALLDRKGVQYNAISVDGRQDIRDEMTEKSGSHTVPQIWIGERHIGGCDDLHALEEADQLDPLLSE